MAQGDVYAVGNNNRILRGDLRPEVFVDDRNPDSSPTLRLVINKRD
jgi:hypothetical protein